MSQYADKATTSGARSTLRTSFPTVFIAIILMIRSRLCQVDVLVGVRGGGQAVAGRRWCRGSSLHGAFDETVPPGGAETVLSTKLGLCHSPAVPMMLPGYLASSFKEVQQWQKARAGGSRSGKGGMTSKAASRIQSAAARSGGGKVSKGSFASRAQRAAASKSR